jgi:hypothetical protein
MKNKPMTWAQAGMMFLFMAICTFGLDMVFNSSLRHELTSLSSDFWQVVVPGDLLGDAAVAFGTRLIINWSLKRQKRADSSLHPGL